MCATGGHIHMHMHRHMLQVGIYIHMPYIYICRQRGVQCVCHKLHIIMCIHTYTCYRWLAAQLFGSVQLICAYIHTHATGGWPHSSLAACSSSVHTYIHMLQVAGRSALWQRAAHPCIHTYTCYRWLAAQLFGSVQLIPVRRPHASDEVVANLAKYPYP